MKKIFSAILLLFAVVGFNLSTLACDCGCGAKCKCESIKNEECNCSSIEGLYDKYQAVYLPSNKVWTTGSMVDDRIVLTKKTTEGSGSYSEYYYGNGKLAIALNSNFEFIKDGQLIAVDNAKLKYYKVVYEKKKFKEILLTDAELQKLFPCAEIVKISQFKNGKIKVDKKLFKKKLVLLVNDTENYYHKYSFKPSYVQTTDIKGLMSIKKYGNIEFSLNGMEEGKLIIKVR